MSARAVSLIVPETHFKAAAQAAEKDVKSFHEEGGKEVRTVRRPTRGIVLKDDTFATLRLVAGTGGNLKLVDAGGRRKEVKKGATTASYMEVEGRRATDVYSNFLLQNIMEERQEKQQILETFGEPYIFFFGQRARIMAFQGILANTWDFNWEAEWWWNYEHYLRGTKCVENDARVFLSFDNTLVGGYILACNCQKSAPERNFVQFQFQLFVTDYSNFSDIGNPYALPGVGTGVDENLGIASSDAELSHKYTASELAPFAPERISSGLGERFLLKDGGVTYLYGGKEQLQRSYEDFTGRVDGPGALADAWKGIQSTTNMVLNTTAQVLGGDVVQVPLGFAGAFSYDNADELNAKLVDQTVLDVGGVVTFSTFADNDDEYVGSSDHYGSALLKFSNYSDLLTQFAEGGKVSEQAKTFWEKAGFKVEPSLLSKLATGIQYARLGLVAYNFVEGMVRYKPKEAAPDFTDGIDSGFGGSVPHYNTDNTYPE